MTKLELYQQMKSELLARRAPLLNEKKQLQGAAKRIVEVEEALLVIDEEVAEYDKYITELQPAPIVKEDVQASIIAR